MLTEVLKQDPEALGRMLPAGIDWPQIAENLRRPRQELYRDWINRILPTLRRHLAGELVDCPTQLIYIWFFLC